MSHDEGPGAPLETNFWGEPWDKNLDGAGVTTKNRTNFKAYEEATRVLSDSLRDALQIFLLAVQAANPNPKDQLPRMVTRNISDALDILGEPSEKQQYEVSAAEAQEDSASATIDQASYDRAISALQTALKNALTVFNDQMTEANPGSYDQLPGMVRKKIDNLIGILGPLQDTAE